MDFEEWLDAVDDALWNRGWSYRDIDEYLTDNFDGLEAWYYYHNLTPAEVAERLN